jgi:hypothetical protein
MSDFAFPPDAAEYIYHGMKLILTAVILLSTIFAFAENAPQSVLPVTNSLVNTNETDSYKPRKTWSKADASTGATRSKAKKQK